VKVVRRIAFPLKNVKDGFVEDSDRSYNWVNTRRMSIDCENPPVTPAIVKGCAPNTEETNAAMKEDSKTSATPYWSVVSIRSSENAIPGRTLGL